MDDERTPPPPHPDDLAPPRAAPPRPRGAVTIVAALAGVALAVTAAVVTPAVLRAGASVERERTAAPDTPPAPAPSDGARTPSDDVTQADEPARWVEDTTALLAGLPGVADVEMNGWNGASAEITLATPLPSPDAAQRTADDAREILTASRGGAIWSLRVLGSTGTGAELQVVDGTDARGTRGSDPATGDPLPDLLGDDPVAFATRLLADDGVRSVGLEPSYASVEVADASALEPTVAAFRDAGRPVSALTTTGYAVNLSFGDPPAVPDDALLGLVVETASRPGVTSLLYEARRPVLPGTPFLTVGVEGDAAAVARWLEDTTHDVPALGFQVHGSARDGTSPVRSGYVGGAAPGVPADGTTCDVDRLTLDAAWFDAALGRRFLTVTARNDDDSPCVLAGSPALRFVASDGSEQEVLVEPDAVGTVEGPVTLAPGGLAQATLSWRGGPTADGPALVTSLLVAPVPGAAESVVPFADVPGAEGGLDLLDGATATVTPWKPGPP